MTSESPTPAPPIVVFDLDNTLVHSRIDFLGIRTAIIDRLLQVRALDRPPANPRRPSGTSGNFCANVLRTSSDCLYAASASVKRRLFLYKTAS